MTLPRRGRPRKPQEERQSLVIVLHVTEAEFDALACRALREGDHLATFARAALLEALGITRYELKAGS